MNALGAPLALILGPFAVAWPIVVGTPPQIRIGPVSTTHAAHTSVDRYRAAPL